MSQNENSSLKQMLQSMYPNAPCVIEGVVSGTNPLRVTLANDSKMVLGKHSFIIPRQLTDYEVEVEVINGVLNSGITVEGQDSLNTTMIIKNGLKDGEIVFLLSFNHGKKYYILDRKG